MNNLKDNSPADLARLKFLWNEWNKANIDPAFKGLIHTPAWRKKRGRAASQNK